MRDNSNFIVMDRRSAITDGAERDYCSAFNVIGKAINKAHRFTLLAKRQLYPTEMMTFETKPLEMEPLNRIHLRISETNSI